MKMRNLVITIVCLAAIGFAGLKIASYFRPQKLEAPKPTKAPVYDPISLVSYATEPPGLGLGTPQDRKWIEYYYRHRRINEAVPVIQRIAKAAEQQTDTAATTWFFGTVLRGNTQVLDQVRAELANAAGQTRAFLDMVLANATAQHITKINSPTDLTRVWAEYLATGDIEKIDLILSVFCDPSVPQPVVMQTEAQSLLVKLAPYHAEVYTAVTEAALLADESCQPNLQRVVNRMDEEFIEKAHDLTALANNLRKQRNFEKAREVIQTALKLFPDSSSAQVALARLAEDEGKLDEAYLAACRLSAINPDEPGSYYRLGRIQFMRGDYQAAITNYEKALKLGYSFHSVWHALGRAYQESGNHSEAVRCFKTYLQLEPHGPNEALVKAYLASMNQPVEDDPNDIVAMLISAKYDALETRLREILQAKKYDSSGRSEIFKAFKYLCSNPTGSFGFEQFIDRFQRWVEARPNSHFAHAAYGQVLIDYAWQARGGGWASTVTTEGWRLFEERLQKARAELERAYELDPSDPIPPANLITVAMGLGLDRDEMEKQFKRGLAADPREFSLYARKLTYLMPKWHGTEKDMFEFARKTVAEAPTNSIAATVLVQAHWEMFSLLHNRDKRYFRRLGVWDEMKHVYTRVCEQFPDALDRRNWFALTAFYAGDYETAARQLEIIGENWDSSVWGERSFFNRVRAETQKRLRR